MLSNKTKKIENHEKRIKALEKEVEALTLVVKEWTNTDKPTNYKTQEDELSYKETIDEWLNGKKGE